MRLHTSVDKHLVAKRGPENLIAYIHIKTSKTKGITKSQIVETRKRIQMYP